MSGFNAGDSVYLSFLYQPEGFGDVPESTDSLILEFYDHNAQLWNHIWSTPGGGLTDFQVGHIRLDSSKYFVDGFQFRFKNYGGLSGALDHWNLDYVNLRSLSGYQDTLFKDFAIVYPVNTLLEDYTSVPWEHWQNNFTGKMTDSVKVTVRNGSNISENNQNGTTEIFHLGGAEGSFTLIGQDLSGGNINYDPRTVYESYHDFSTGYHYDETKTGTTQEFDFVTNASAQFPNFPGNDSTFSTQVFSNYYAYDDGTAEKAYGPTGIQSRLAIQFTPYEADSLIGAYIHWVPTVDDVSDKLFYLTVWDDNNGQPGTVIYEDSNAIHTPRYGGAKNIFSRYYTMDDTFNPIKVPVNGTFYIGWRQVEAERMNVGLDMNIPNNDKTFFSINQGATWSTSIFPGSVMIRPMYSTVEDGVFLNVEDDLTIEPTFKVFPNPTTGTISIETRDFDYQGVQVLNLQGRVVVESLSNSVDLSREPAGMYLIKFNGSNEIQKVLKH